jgi:4-amino-4-deoxy-L-arabinose transferase-like glycosyltransferase
MPIEAAQEKFRSSVPAAYWAVLAVLILFHVCFLESWLRRDTRPPAWDESHHLRIALDYRDAIGRGEWGTLFRPVYSNYPPLYHAVLATALDRKGDFLSAVDRAVRRNLLFWTILIVSVFFAGLRLGSPATGLAAAALVSFYGGTLFLVRRPMTDVPLASWVAMTFALLAWRDRMPRRFGGAALGLAVAAGLLTKWSFAVYAGVPLFLSLVRDWREGRRDDVVAFAAVAAVVAGPWYLFNLVPSALRIAKLSSLREAGDPNVWTLAGWTWYLRGFVRHQIFWPMAVPFAAGLWLAVRSRHRDLILWLAVPLLAFGLIRNKDLRYFAPCLPAVALLSAWSADLFERAVWRRGWRTGWTAAAAVFGLFFSLPAADPFFWPMLGRSVERDVPRNEDWKALEILRALPSEETRVSLIANHPYFHAGVFRFAADWNHREDLIFSVPKRNLGDFADFILWKDAALGPEYTLGYAAEADRLLRTPPLWLEKTFSVSRRWALPDGSEAVLWARDVVDGPWPAALGEIEIELNEFPLPRFRAERLRVRLLPESPASARKGFFKSVRIQCDRLDYRGLILENVSIEGRDVQVNLPRLLQDREIHFLRVGDLWPSLELQAEHLAAYLRKKAKWLEDPRVEMSDSLILRGKAGGIPLNASVAAVLSPDRRSVLVALDSLRVGGIPLPLFLVRPFVRKSFSLESSKDLPFSVGVESLDIKDGRVVVRGGS